MSGQNTNTPWVTAQGTCLGILMALAVIFIGIPFAMMVLAIVFVSSVAPDSGGPVTTPVESRASEISKKNLEVEMLRIYQSSNSYSIAEMRFNNVSGEHLKHWAVDIVVYDSRGTALGTGGGMVSEIGPGIAKIDEIGLININAREVARWEVTLAGVVGASGRREDGDYIISIRR